MRYPWIYFYTGSRTEPNLNDVALAFDQLGIHVHELEDYVHQVEQNPSLCVPPVVPAIGKENMLSFADDGFFPPPIAKIEPPPPVEEEPVVLKEEPMEGL